ncbi:MAG: DUF4145 domain-containing protein [Bacillota bacterium]|nr:DUF4145 domain-containing protein [Bacillota bacterium]
MDQKKGYLIEECRFCGNKTKLDIVASHHVAERGEFCFDEYWLILVCSVCRNISFAKNYSGEDTLSQDENGHAFYEDYFVTLYPLNTYQGSNVPKQVHNAFQTALKARYLDGAICLISLRRTLEIICKDQGETKGDLVGKIQRLSNKGILPPILKDVSNILRTMGNEAAHGDEINYSENEINEMINFTQIIIEYVYILPSRLSKIKNGNDDPFNL